MVQSQEPPDGHVSTEDSLSAVDRVKFSQHYESGRIFDYSNFEHENRSWPRVSLVAREFLMGFLVNTIKETKC